MISNPGAAHHDTEHAKAARRAVRQLIAAKRAGDAESASLYARLASEAVERHLTALRHLTQ